MLLALASCGPRDAAYNPSKFVTSGLLVPPDVAVPHGARPGNYRGLFLMQANGGSGICCWIAPSAVLDIRKDRDAKFLVLSVYVPDVPVFHAHSQTLKIELPQRSAAYVRGLSPGFRTVRLPLSARLKRVRGTVTVRVHASIVYAVPGTPDAPGPRYALILTSMYFD